MKTLPTTTQQIISPIHSKLTTPHKKTSLPQTTLDSTIKLFLIPRNSHME